MLKLFNTSLRRAHASPFKWLPRPRTLNISSLVQQSPRENDQIIVAMSSGVDSSVCAAMYAEKFKNVKGIYMANWTSDRKCVEQDWLEVQNICDILNIPCERLNFEKEYWINVFEPMIEMYKAGLTPNPDVGCNKYVKFGAMVDCLSKRFKDSDNWWLVTGHYARILRDAGKYRLLRGKYLPKDQSYYLSTVPQNIMSHLLLPLGHMTKPEVRALALQKYNLPNATKKDSQGLCFVSQEGKFSDFLADYIEDQPGNIITKSGEIVGRHRGLWHGTIGQRCRIPLHQSKYPGAWFYSEKKYDTNELVIVDGTNNPELYSNIVEVSDWCWSDSQFSTKTVKNRFKMTVQDRSLQQDIECIMIENIDELSRSLKFKLGSLRRAVSPGQNLVLYGDELGHGDKNDQIILGSGVITRAFKA